MSHISPSHSRRLDEAIQSALHGTPMAAIAVPRADGGSPLTILASSVRAQDVDRFADASLKGAAVLLFIVDALQQSRHTGQRSDGCLRLDPC